MDARAIEKASRELALRRWVELANAALAIVAATLAALSALFESRVALVVAIAAGFAAVLAAAAAVRRHWLIERLALDSDAYEIAAIRRYGCRLTSPRGRERLSRSLRTLVADPWRYGPCIRPAHVEPFAADLLELAHELEDARVEVEPVSAASCMRLLSDGAESPLLNPALPTEDLRAVLRRIRGGIHRAA